MDDEDLANVLRSTANVGLPGFYSNNVTPQASNDDPFANPFANPFATEGPSFPVATSGFASQAVVSQDDDSPYVNKLRDEGTIPETPGFASRPEYETGFDGSASTSGFREVPYSAAFDERPAVTDPAQTPFEVPAFTTTPFGTTSPIRAGEFARSSDPFSSPGRRFDDPFGRGMPRSPPAPAAASGTTSPARIRPSTDILGLLSEDDGSTSALKKAFVSSDPKRASVDAKADPAPAAPVVRVGGASRKKVGISFDSVSVQREREKKEREERERVAAEAKRKREREQVDQEKERATRAEASGSKEVVDGTSSSVNPMNSKQTDGQDEARHVDTAGAQVGKEGEGGDSILEQAAREAASPTPPGPHVSAAVAAQILESGHPDQAAQQVAETIARQQAETLDGDEVVPAEIPLPPSGVTSPAIASRGTSPSPERTRSPPRGPDERASLMSSPLDAVDGVGNETNFKALAIGGSSQSQSQLLETSSPQAESSTKNASWGRAFEEEPETPTSSSSRHPEPLGWTTETFEAQQSLDSWPQSSPAWQSEADHNILSQNLSPYPAKIHEEQHQAVIAEASATTEHVRSPTRNRLLTQPVFSISISDPTKVGDPVRGYIVYTVTTRTTSPHYKRGEFSVLRRFSDFLWLIEAVSHNNPGVVVPPMPDKHAFGRFEEQFVETRRSALERALGKMANHPVLSLDPDLKLFLSSDAFTIDVKHRRQEMTQEKQSVLSSLGGSIGGPRFVEQDDWFVKQKHFLDSLESQIKALVKSLEASSKQRLDLVNGFSTLTEALQALAESDLSLALSQVLHRFSQLSEDERSMHENQARMDVVRLLNVADEQLRLIGSVRAAFSSRIRSYFAWQNAQGEARRIRVQTDRERAKRGGRYAPHDANGDDTPEIAQAERRALDAQSDFDAVSRLVKLEFSRFEQERIEDLKSTMELYIDEAVEAQRKLVLEWEAFHKELSAILAQHQRTN